MICARCQTPNEPDTTTCASCGAPRSPVCPVCRREPRLGAIFCDGCGKRLVEEPAREPRRVPLRSAAPVEYTPRYLAEKVLSRRSAIEGERKAVTVMFADVKGSMELAAKVDLETWHRILDGFFSILADGVHRYEGTVNQYTGDGIMALFGAPIAHEDHAQRACHAALLLQGELRRYSREVKREYGLDFSVRMGLNSGDVVVGKIGGDLRMDYTAQGHTVGLASRMEELAAPNAVYVSEATAAIVAGWFELEDLGRFKLKGIEEPVRVFELKGPGALQSRFDVSRARGLSRFIGRERELARLEAALDETIAGHGQVVGVIGNAGVGKTRLCYEFLERCRHRGILVYEGRATPHTSALRHVPVIQILRSYFEILDTDSPAVAREKIAGRILMIDEELRDTLPLVFEFMGVSDPDHPAPRIDPEARQRQISTVLRRTALDEGPITVTLIEDLHWIDRGSERLIAQWITAIENSRRMLVVNFRPEFRADWMRLPWYREIAVEPLAEADTRALLDDWLGQEPSLEDLAAKIHARTAGNPLFTEEIVRDLIDTGRLEGVRGHYRLTGPVEHIDVPSSVQALLAARIDRLPDRERLVLQTAAVIGREFREDVLAHIVRMDPLELLAALHMLEDGQFVVQISVHPHNVYAFRHPLVVEVAYDSQLSDRRARIHRSTAHALEALDPDEGADEQGALIAGHYEKAGDPLAAAIWHRRAAEHAIEHDAMDAMRHWRRIRRLLTGTEDSPERRSLVLAACIGTLSTFFRVGGFLDEARSAFEQGMELAESAKNLYAQARLLTTYASAREHMGETDGVLELAERAVRAGEELGDPGVRLAALQQLAWTLGTARGHAREALAIVSDALGRFAPDLELGIEFFSGIRIYPYLVNLRATYHAMCGDLAEATSDVDHALRLARECGDEEVIGWTLCTSAAVRRLRGDLRGAMNDALHAVLIAEKTGSVTDRIVSALTAGTTYRMNGRYAESIAILDSGLRLVRERRVNVHLESHFLADLAEAHLSLGDTARAAELADEAVAVADARQHIGLRAHAALSHASVLLATQGAAARERIQHDLGRAERVIDELGRESERPHLHMVRAALADALGDPIAAEREKREALAAFRRIGAEPHATRLAAALHQEV